MSHRIVFPLLALTALALSSLACGQTAPQVEVIERVVTATPPPTLRLPPTVDRCAGIVEHLTRGAPLMEQAAAILNAASSDMMAGYTGSLDDYAALLHGVLYEWDALRPPVAMVEHHVMVSEALHAAAAGMDYAAQGDYTRAITNLERGTLLFVRANDLLPLVEAECIP